MANNMPDTDAALDELIEIVYFKPSDRERGVYLLSSLRADLCAAVSDEARKEIIPSYFELVNGYPHNNELRDTLKEVKTWAPNHPSRVHVARIITVLENALFAPASAHVPGIEKLKVLLEPYRGDRIHPKVNQALEILDNQTTPELNEAGIRPNNELVHITLGELQAISRNSGRCETSQLADLRAKVEGMKRSGLSDPMIVNTEWNAALDAMIALIDGKCSPQEE